MPRPVRAEPTREAKPEPRRVANAPAARHRPATITIMRLQAGAGNAAVGRALAGAAPGAPLGPLATQLGGAEQAFARHHTGAGHARAAQAAARPPADDGQAKGHTAQIAKMAAAAPVPFDKAVFVDAVFKHVADAAPKSGEDADALAATGQAVTLPPGTVGELTRSKDAAAKPLSDATAASPDTGRATEKTVRDLPATTTPARPTIDPGTAVTPAVPAARTDFTDGPRRIEQEMAAHDLTDDQLTKANEPQFSAALDAKQAVTDHATHAPSELRGRETQQRGALRGAAQVVTGDALAVLAAHSMRAKTATRGRQQTARARDEAARADVSAHVNDVAAKTKNDVDNVLKNLEDTVPKMFASLETIARLNFMFDYRGHLQAYKDERHSGWFGWARAIGDTVTGLPDKVEKIYDAAKQRYLDALRKAVSDIADFVARELTRAKQRIAAGRGEIAAYVEGLSPKLHEVGVEAAADIDAQFEDLDASIDDTVTDLATDLGQQYAEGVAAVNADIEESRKDEQGLLADAKDFLSGVWNTVGELKNLLLSVLKEFVHAAWSIIKHPIDFFGSWVKSLAAGVEAFFGDLKTEVVDGLKTWLFGKLPDGIELPDSFDVEGLIKLALSLLGRSWEWVKQTVAGLVPEPVRDEVLAWVQTLATGGPAALVAMVVEHAGEIADAIRQKIIDYIESTVIHAALDKVVMLLGGPTGAFIETCKLIYHALKWLWDNLKRIGELVLGFLGTIDEVAEHGDGDVVAGVPQKIKGKLTAAIPMLIDGLAEMVGLGDIAPRVRALVDTVRRPVKAITDKIVRTAVKFGKRLARKLSGSRLGRAGARLKAKAGEALTKSKAWVGAKARRVGEVLGLVDKPFAVGAEAHTLSVDTRTGAVYLASRRGPVDARIRAYIIRANERRRAAKLPPIHVETQIAIVHDQVNEITRRVLDAKEGRDKVAHERLDTLASMVANLLITLRGGGGDTDADMPSGLGRIARHGDQEKHKTGALVRRLESEHVLPVRIVSMVLEGLGLEGIERPSAEDNLQHTIMIYEGAAHRKTRGTESADVNLINQLKALAATGVPAIYGRGQMARRLRQVTLPSGRSTRRTAGEVAEVAERLEEKSSEVQATLHDKLPAVMAARADMTAKAVIATTNRGARSSAGTPTRCPTRPRFAPPRRCKRATSWTSSSADCSPGAVASNGTLRSSRVVVE